jgi:glycosyltransferase involved in cell wall biosynthesis
MNHPSREPRWSVIVPYYNEAKFIDQTLRSLAEQRYRNFMLILVDNASTDGTTDVCKKVMASYPDIPVRYVTEHRQGQLCALDAGFSVVTTEFVATCDADTLYPPHYLELCTELFDRGGDKVVSVMAADIYDDPEAPASRFRRLHKLAVSHILSRQVHAGGYAQTFRTDALRQSGGWSTDYWPYVLFDHEMPHRVFRLGKAKYHYNLWCRGSERRANRTSVTWNLYERVLYHLTSYRLKDWFFYSFLSRRFEMRGLAHVNLRDKSWE